MKKALNWVVLGAGSIANQMATSIALEGRKLYGVANRTYEKAVRFAQKHGVEKVYESFEAVFADPKVDIVYIATTHDNHYNLMKQALQAGKHILVEKSITLSSCQLEEMVALAKEKDLVLAEAMTIWHMPLYRQLWALTGEGELGRVQVITINFGSFKDYDLAGRFYNPHLGGGALLDIGVYALSLVRSFMERQPQRIESFVRFAPTGVDEQAAIILENDVGQMATVALSLRSRQPKRAVISCEKGYIEIVEYPRAWEALVVDGATGAKRTLGCGNRDEALLYEMQAMEQAVETGDQTLLKLDLTRDVMAIMTRLREDWGFQFPDEA